LQQHRLHQSTVATPLRCLFPRQRLSWGFVPYSAISSRSPFFSGLLPTRRPEDCLSSDVSACRVSHPLDGLLLLVPCRFISPDKHSRGSPFKDFPSRVAVSPSSDPCLPVVQPSCVSASQSPPSRLCSTRKSVGYPRRFRRLGAPILSWASALQGFLPSHRSTAFTAPPLLFRDLRQSETSLRPSFGWA